MDKNPYLKPYRLSDIIRMITALGIDQKSFRTHEGLNESFKDKPSSSKNWLNIAKEHPEFFRIHSDGKQFILLMRFMQYPDLPNGGNREKLTVLETQKLIDQALILHDKQLARYQRNSFRFPFYGSLIAAIVSLLVVIINYYTNKSLNNKIDQINTQLESINNNFKQQ